MPWICFWSGTSSSDKDNRKYRWYGKVPSDEELKDTAEEFVPNWLRFSDRYHYGHETVETLPDDVRSELIREYENKKSYAEKMLELLRMTEVMEG